MAVTAGAKIRRADFIGQVDDLTADVEELQAQAAQFAPTARLRGVNATLNGAIGTINPAVTQCYHQFGSEVFMTDDAGAVTIDFPSPFSIVLGTLTAQNGDANVGLFLVHIVDVSLADFSVMVTELDGSPVVETGVRINWRAEGL